MANVKMWHVDFVIDLTWNETRGYTLGIGQHALIEAHIVSNLQLSVIVMLLCCYVIVTLLLETKKTKKKNWPIFEFLPRYLTMCCCEHKVFSHQHSPTVVATSELQWGHVGARVWGSVSASNNTRTISSWNTKYFIYYCLMLIRVFIAFHHV